MLKRDDTPIWKTIHVYIITIVTLLQIYEYHNNNKNSNNLKDPVQYDLQLTYLTGSHYESCKPSIDFKSEIVLSTYLLYNT